MWAQGAADLALLPVTQRITASTCKLAYRLQSASEPPAGEQPPCSLTCSAVGRHLVIAGSVAGTTARHVTLSAEPEQRGSGSAAPSSDSWSHSWVAARPLWVRVKDELARPLLADAARQGLCAPPPSLLALDAEALDTILQQLPVRCRCHAVRHPRVPSRFHLHAAPTSANHTVDGTPLSCRHTNRPRVCRRGIWPPCPRPAASCAARRARTRCGSPSWSRTSRRAPARSAAAAGRLSTGRATATGRRHASGGWRSAATRSCGRCRAFAAATLSCRHLGLAALSVRAATRLKLPCLALLCVTVRRLDQAVFAFVLTDGQCVPYGRWGLRSAAFWGASASWPSWQPVWYTAWIVTSFAHQFAIIQPIASACMLLCCVCTKCKSLCRGIFRAPLSTLQPRSAASKACIKRQVD